MTVELSHSAPPITVDSSGPVTTVTVGTGDKRNALTSQNWDELARVVREGDSTEVSRVLHIRGRDEMFCAGSDMTEWIDADLDAVEESFARMEAAFHTIEECSIPVVAEVHGTAAGAGCQLALACDMRFLADSARIGMPIARLGINASPAFAQRMITLVGPALTRRMLYTGMLLDAPQAVSSGLAEQHLPDADLPDFTADTLQRIAAQPTAAVRAAKHAVSVALRQERHGVKHNGTPMVSPVDFHHGIAAFLG